MKELQICKADPIGETEVHPVQITINSDLSGAHSLEIEEIYMRDSDELSRALFHSLPQGTFDRLIIKMLKRKTSVYRGITRS